MGKGHTGISCSLCSTSNFLPKALENRLVRIYEDKLDEIIFVDYYTMKFKEFNKKKKRGFNLA
ncbi:hypothetical protein ISS03_02095 [Patescibacteria group bacterium]|nr:hypothetical protein [Patescibacteria group bacterium]